MSPREASGPVSGRGRLVPAALVVGTIALGLASRRWPVLSPIFGKYPGDASWAAMIFFGGAVLRPGATTASLSVLAGIVCVVVECAKLYTAPWIVALRYTTIGHLVFGHAFSYANLFSYAVGIGIAAVVDVACRRAQRSAPTR